MCMVGLYPEDRDRYTRLENKDSKSCLYMLNDPNRSSSREGPLGIHARSTPHQRALDGPTILEYLNDSRPSSSTPDKRRLQNERKERKSQPHRSTT